MSDLFWLTEAQMRRISPYFPLSHGIALARCPEGIRSSQDDLQSVRSLESPWSFNGIFAGLADKVGDAERLMIDATHLKAHRTAASLLEKGLSPAVSAVRRAA